jgi:flagellar basal-body rod protein FlgB
MVDMGFTWKVMEKDLEGLSKRFKATSRNLANVNTPGYARRNVSFENELRDIINSDRKLKMDITNTGHIPSRPRAVADVKPLEIKINDEMYRLDENNVDPEREMAILAETRMMYSAITRFAGKKRSGIVSAISGRS